MPVVTGDLRVSLILKLDQSVDLDDVEALIRKKGIRLSGGIVPHPPRVLESDRLRDAIAKCGRGFWISDATNVVKSRLDSGMSIVESVMGSVSGGWYVPTVLGYRALTRFDKRPGARDGLRHAYGEAMVGLVRYDSIHAILKNDSDAPPGLWFYRWATPSTFLVQQKGNSNG